MTTYGYKAMLPDMTCEDFKFEIGKTYNVDNDTPLKLYSDSGFHFCQNFEDVFNFYEWYECRVFKVATDSTVLTDGEESITKKITILEEISQDDLKYENLKSDEAKNYYSIMLEKDSELVYNSYKDNESYEIRVAIVNKLTNEQQILTFKDDLSWEVRRAVINKLTDEKLIFEMFKDDKEEFVRFTVVEKLTNEKLIFDTFKDDKEEFVRAAVIRKLTNEQLIFDTFKDDSHWLVRYAVVDKLTDPEMLKYLENDTNRNVRKTVKFKLKNK